MNNLFFDFSIYKVPDLENFQEELSGNNQRCILIGFLDENRDELEIFLKKIISSAKIEYEKDCIILRGSSAALLPPFSKINSMHKIEKAVLFGMNGNDLGLNIHTPLYIPFKFNNCSFMFADKLSVIEQSVERKKALWLGLQTLFLSSI